MGFRGEPNPRPLRVKNGEGGDPAPVSGRTFETCMR